MLGVIDIQKAAMIYKRTIALSVFCKYYIYINPLSTEVLKDLLKRKKIVFHNMENCFKWHGKKQLPAIDVFKHSNKYIKDIFMNLVTWMLWYRQAPNEPGKQFMVEAAEMVNKNHVVFKELLSNCIIV